MVVFSAGFSPGILGGEEEKAVRKVEGREGRRGLTLGSHSCLFQLPPLTTGPASCPTRQMAAETPETWPAFSSSFSATYLDSP